MGNEGEGSPVFSEVAGLDPARLVASADYPPLQPPTFIIRTAETLLEQVRSLPPVQGPEDPDARLGEPT